MAKRQRSTGQLLRRAGSTQSQLAILSQWADAWDTEVSNLIRRLERAVSNDDYDEQCIALGQLKAVHQKKMPVLKSAVNTDLHNHLPPCTSNR